MNRLEQAIFAGGCFWCIQEAFDGVHGVVFTEAGYTGGVLVNPRYEDVQRGKGGHVEAVRVTFDPEIIGYASLLDVFWRQIDPLQQNGQLSDIGPAYRSIIFVLDENQRHLADLSRRHLEQSGRLAAPVATQIRPAGPFYPAEAEHQYFFRRHADHYQRYKAMSRRAERLKAIWG
ncbi:MAG: peptide-methionine (S)-S-oxide reductase [Zetaproteobacteria bacterium]|nr:MAG: peptide-methionine (S)-S-oxide reductase [Zetaproteobacteria bacterium]